MLDKTPLANFLRQASSALPEGAATIRKEIEENLRPLVEKRLGDLNLVTREEFNAQLSLVARLTQQVDALEAKLNALSEATNKQQR